jgi:hypothetical protein
MSTANARVSVTDLPKTAQVDVKVPTEKEASAPGAGVTVLSPPRENPMPAENAAGNSTEAAIAVAVLPVVTPPTEAQARVIANYKLPDRIRKLMDRESAVTAEALLRHPPILAGQSRDEYFDLVEAVFLDHRPYTYDDIALVVQLVNDEWKVFTFGEVQKWLLNAAIGKGLVDELTDRDEGPADDRQTRMRGYRRIVFGAISGDPLMLEQLENKLGVGCLGFSVYSTRLIGEDIRAHVFADAMINAALRRRNSTLQQLAKLAQCRFDRMTMKRLTAEDIRALRANVALKEHCLRQMERVRYADKGSTEGVAAAHEGSEPVRPPFHRFRPLGRRHSSGPMASPAQIAANRRNALHSTGPRTATGKARSGANALKRGLRSPLDRNASIVEEIEALTTDIARLAKKPREAVRSIAEHQLKIMRIQQTRTKIINRYIERLARDDLEGSNPQARMATATAIPEIGPLEDYERRALSRLRKVLRNVDESSV